MGSSFSSPHTAADDGYPPPSMVVTVDGYLLEYSLGVTAADVLAATAPGCVLCNSDKLLFDGYPPAVGPHEELDPGQIYFLLPATVLRRQLSGANVAALAVRASAAMTRTAAAPAEKRGRKWWRRMRVAPAV
ncbi:hypothetical protein KSP39_PZI024163 [Platanthera zijinensis]|uniref:Uncharacterized protein n=1 Tax=Platanthera zijinensis TaxID=2320716 RepID=A0AAP0FTR6_9ASPA